MTFVVGNASGAPTSSNRIPSERRPVMSLDTTFQPKPLTATLHYLKRGAEKPVRYVFDPPPGVPQWNGIDDPRTVAIEDARGREDEFSLDRNGFQLVHR